MNTPPTIKRHTLPPDPSQPDGHYVGGLTREDYALEFAAIIASFVHLEKAMYGVLTVLLGGSDLATGGYVWNAIISPRARISLLQQLLQRSPANKNLPAEWDEIIAEFNALNGQRNDYAHGLWFTNEQDNSVWLSRPQQDKHNLWLLAATPEPLANLVDVNRRIFNLTVTASGHAAKEISQRLSAVPSQQ